MTLRRDYPEPPAVGGCRWIQLGRARFALVDEGAFEHLSQWSWTVNDKGYAAATHGEGASRVHLKMHKLVLSVPCGKGVDHINGNKLDNRRDNLREADGAQNQHNARAYGRVSKYKGVGRHHKKWHARIYVRRELHLLGDFDREEDAARAFDEAARRLQGQFARLNFPHEGEQSALTTELARL